MAQPPDRESRAALWEALSAFQKSPGRHAVAHGEPKLLFHRLREVMQLAAGRAAASGAGSAPPPEVEQAARFFVRTVLFRPNGSHYDVLGVGHSDDPAVIREHYRLLIRMTHPDFAGEHEAWPDDAAARVNRAYDVLSSPTRRAEYDAQIRPSEDRGAGSRPATPPPSRRYEASAMSWRKRLGAYVSGGLAVGALAALALLWPSAEDTSLGTLATATPEAPLLKLTESPEEGPVGAVAAPSAGVSSGRKPVVDPVARADRAAALREAPQEAARPRRDAPAVAPPAVPVVAGMAQGEFAASPETAVPAPTAARDKAPAAADISAYQPLLADLLHMLESGQADRLQRWTARATQQDDSAERFANAYRRLMGDSVVTGLGQVRFDLRSGADRPVVQGLVQLRMLDRNQQATVRDFRLRAQFVAGATGPQLAALDVE